MSLKPAQEVKNRRTKTVVTFYKSGDEWFVQCKDHGFTGTCDNRWHAEQLLRNPLTWCETCAANAVVDD